jgi:hypothetical protein
MLHTTLLVNYSLPSGSLHIAYTISCNPSVCSLYSGFLAFRVPRGRFLTQDCWARALSTFLLEPDQTDFSQAEQLLCQAKQGYGH